MMPAAPVWQKGDDTMTEREKCDAGLLYCPGDPEILAEMFRAHELCMKLDAIPFGNFKGREAILRELFGSAGKDPVVEMGFKCDLGRNIHVGDGFYCNFNCVIYDSTRVEIGNFVWIGPNATLCTATHPVEADARVNEKGEELAFPIKIGNRVWIGGGAFINPGVTIGDDAVIASGAVVIHDVPAGTLVAGVPAEVKKTIGKDHAG